MNRKRKGTRLEYRTIKWLRDQHYECIRAAGSFGPWDIVAISRIRIRLIQVKANGWGSIAERDKLALFEAPSYCSKEIIRWDDYSRRPRIWDIRFDKPEEERDER